uniref:Interferon alpha/beta receptor 2 n=1 Tax=Nannospalax galili TaxID=1026970 RepID=A0A8C6QIW4_NANGA
MFSNYNVSAITLLNLYLMVYVSVLFGTSPTFSEYSDESCTMNLTIQNFQLILSWEVKNRSIQPTHYTLWYTIMSKPEDPKIVGNCTNITKPSCDLTDVWEIMDDHYIPIVELYKGNSMVGRCMNSFWASDFYIEPPRFEIVGFLDHINVTLEFPSVTPKIYGKEIQEYASLVIEKQWDKIVKLNDLKLNRDFSGNFTYILDNLIPNTNYCVSVYFEPLDVEKIIKSPIKCIFLQPDQESGLSISAKIGIIITGWIVLFFISSILMLRRTGYICLKNNFPKVLNFHNFLASMFAEPPPSEAVDMLEIIHTNKKKKLWNYSYGDESDSEEEEEEVPKASATGYTTHGLMGKHLSQAPDPSASSQESQCEDSAVEESDEPGAELEPPREARPDPWQPESSRSPRERRERVLQDSYPRHNSSSTDEPGDKVIFNVNLNSVFLRVLDDEETSEVLPLAEDTIDLEEDPHRIESSLLMASGERTQPPHHSSSSQCLWTEEESSDKTDSSGSDTDADVGDGYIMR